MYHTDLSYHRSPSNVGDFCIEAPSVSSLLQVLAFYFYLTRYGECAFTEMFKVIQTLGMIVIKLINLEREVWNSDWLIERWEYDLGVLPIGDCFINKLFLHLRRVQYLNNCLNKFSSAYLDSTISYKSFFKYNILCQNNLR